MKLFLSFLGCLCWMLAKANAFTVAQHSMGTSNTQLNAIHTTETSRRQLVLSFIAGTALTAFTPAFALDMDAFVNSELRADTANCDPKKDPKCLPKLTQDEALCKYGQSGQARADACKRVKTAGGEIPKAGSQGKSLGGAYAM